MNLSFLRLKLKWECHKVYALVNHFSNQLIQRKIHKVGRMMQKENNQVELYSHFGIKILSSLNNRSQETVGFTNPLFCYDYCIFDGEFF